MKKCPFCAEQIQVEAIKCRFCGEFLTEKPVVRAPATATQTTQRAPLSAQDQAEIELATRQLVSSWKFGWMP